MVRDLISQISASRDPHYCVRVTAEDGERGEAMLRQFQDNERTIPTVLTTSQKLSTGVDARNVRNIVLMRPIRSIVEFKQIVGRGTRVYPGKDHFTILDFVRAYEHFQDPEWDGPPDDVVRPEDPPSPAPAPEPDTPPEAPEPEVPADAGPKLTRVTLGPGRARTIRYVARQRRTGSTAGRSAPPAFLERLFGDLAGLLPDGDALRRHLERPRHPQGAARPPGGDGLRRGPARRHAPPDRGARLRRLRRAGLRALRVGTRRAAPSAPTACAAGTLAERDGDEMRAFLEHVLGHYVAGGAGELDPERLGANAQSARYGTIRDARRRLGDVPAIQQAFADLQRALYRA